MSIRLNRIYKRYNNKTVLENLSFEIGKNETVALIGNNGAGKSTTINILCNLIPYKGNFYIDKVPVSPDYSDYKKNIGVVFSEPIYIDTLTIKEYWQFAARFFDVQRTDLENRTNDLMNLFELEDSNKPIKKLSSGQKIKVSIGAALIHNPDIFLLDEPFNSLDVKSKEKVIALLKKIKGQKTILLTSHDLDTVVDLCDRYLILDNGSLILDINKDRFENHLELKNYIKTTLSENNIHVKMEWLR